MSDTPLPYTGLGVGQQDTEAPKIPFTYTSENEIRLALERTHGDELEKIRVRREYRKHRVNVDELRKKKQILPYETRIPDRSIDTNVRQEKRPYISYVENSTTVLSFYDHLAPEINLTPLDDFTTSLWRVGGWKTPYFYAIDCLLVHGGAAFEVVFDETEPSKTSIEYIRRDHLLIPAKARRIQNCSRLGRIYELTKQQFNALAGGFNPAVVLKINEHYEHRDEFIKIIKWFSRDPNGVVYNMWFAATEVGAEDFLRPPLQHEVGIFDQQVAFDGTPAFLPRPLKRIPIFLAPYHAEEDETFLEIQGRAALDQHAQEALTSVYSSTVNAAYLNSQFFPTRKPGDITAQSSNDTLYVLKPGEIADGDFSIFQPAGPNAIALSVAQAIATRKSQETGNVDYAAMQRQDTAKTATELNQAEKAAAELSSINISLFSECQLEIFAMRWEVVKSQIQMQKIPLPLTLQPLIPHIFSPTLRFTMSADAQVVKRAQQTAEYLKHYPMVVGTEFQQPYFHEMMRNTFPNQYQRWLVEAEKYRQESNFLRGALEILSALPLESVPPESQQKVMQFIDQLHLFLNPPQNGSRQQPSTPTPA